MPSKKPYIMIRTEKEIIEKFQKIADSENRSMSNLGETLIMERINEYEKKNGKIKAKEQQGIHFHDNSGKVIVGDIGGDVKM